MPAVAQQQSITVSDRFMNSVLGSLESELAVPVAIGVLAIASMVGIAVHSNKQEAARAPLIQAVQNSTSGPLECVLPTDPVKGSDKTYSVVLPAAAINAQNDAGIALRAILPARIGKGECTPAPSIVQ